MVDSTTFMFDYELRSILNHFSGKCRSQSLTHSIQLSRSGIPKIHSNILASIERATDKNYNETNVYIQLCFTEISKLMSNYIEICNTIRFIPYTDNCSHYYIRINCHSIPYC